jgi:hypothetical protein
MNDSWPNAISGISYDPAPRQRSVLLVEFRQAETRYLGLETILDEWAGATGTRQLLYGPGLPGTRQAIFDDDSASCAALGNPRLQVLRAAWRFAVV